MSRSSSAYHVKRTNPHLQSRYCARIQRQRHFRTLSPRWRLWLLCKDFGTRPVPESSFALFCINQIARVVNYYLVVVLYFTYGWSVDMLLLYFHICSLKRWAPPEWISSSKDSVLTPDFLSQISSMMILRNGKLLHSQPPPPQRFICCDIANYLFAADRRLAGRPVLMREG